MGILDLNRLRPWFLTTARVAGGLCAVGLRRQRSVAYNKTKRPREGVLGKD